MDDRPPDDLTRLVIVVLRRWWVVALLVTAVAGVVYYLSDRSPDVYAAESQIRIFDPRTESVFGDAGTTRFDTDTSIDTHIEIIESDAVVGPAIAHLDTETASDVDAVTARRLGNTEIVRIRVTSEIPNVAQEASTAVAEFYVDHANTQTASGFFDRSEELRASADSLQQSINELQDQLEELGTNSSLEAGDLLDERSALLAQQLEFDRRASELEIEGAIRGAGVELLNTAQLPEAPFSPRPLRNALAAGILAAIAGVVLAILLDRRDVTLKDVNELRHRSIDPRAVGFDPRVQI